MRAIDQDEKVFFFYRCIRYIQEFNYIFLKAHISFSYQFTQSYIILILQISQPITGNGNGLFKNIAEYNCKNILMI